MSRVSRLLGLLVVGARRRRAVGGVARAGSLMAALLIAGCGGGVSFYFDDWDDLAPAVDLAASSTSAPAGASVHLAAAAADESGIDRVSFYRYDGNTAVR